MIFDGQALEEVVFALDAIALLVLPVVVALL